MTTPKQRANKKMSDTCEGYEVNGYFLQENGIIRNPEGVFVCRIKNIEELQAQLTQANTKIDRLCDALLEAANELDEFERIYVPHEHNDCIDKYRKIVKEIKEND